MAPVLFRLLAGKFFPPALPPPGTFNGQTILITGATGGLGLEAAVHFVNLGAATVIITGRTLVRGNAAKTTIEARTGKKGIIQVRELNMNTFANVKAFVEGLKAEVKNIDSVILNAGLYKITYDKTPDGFEETLQVNTLSTALLGLLLIPWMREAPSATGKPQHLAFVGSGTHTAVDLEVKDFPKKDVLRYYSEEKHFVPGQGSYPLSKLLLMYAVQEIAKVALKDDGRPSPIISSLCPGACRSDLGRQYHDKGWLYTVGMAVFFGALSKSTADGARTLVLSTLTTPEENGKYIKHYGSEEEYERQSAKNIKSGEAKNLQQEVWKEMLQIFGDAIPDASRAAQPKL